MLAPSPWWSRIASHRLAHFLAGGALLFALDRSGPATPVIHLASARLDAEQAAAPGSDGALWRERAVQDEVLYREARRLGLDQDDPIVRRRLIEKLLLLSEDWSGAARAPTDAELQEELSRNPARYARPAQLELAHVVGASAEALEALRPALEVWSADTAHERLAPPLGDPWPTSRSRAESRVELARELGEEVAALAERAPLRTWVGPVRSPAGWHLLRVSSREPARPASLAEARSQLELEVMTERKLVATRALLRDSFARYRVEVDGQPLAAMPLGPRLAERSDPSGED